MAVDENPGKETGPFGWGWAAVAFASLLVVVLLFVLWQGVAVVPQDQLDLPPSTRPLLLIPMPR